MAAPQNFRTAFNGFHREDVVNYISFITNKHETALNELRAEAEELRAQLAGRAEAPDDALAQQLGALTAENQALQEQIQTLTQAAGEKDAQIEALQAELEQTKASLPRTPDATGRWAEELNAYRRAESVERLARERANQMFDLAGQTLTDASLRVEQTASSVAELVDQLESDLAKLHLAISDSGNILVETAMRLGSIRPEEG